MGLQIVRPKPLNMVEFTILPIMAETNYYLMICVLWAIGLLSTYALYFKLLQGKLGTGSIPFFDHRKGWEISFTRAKIRFLTAGADLLQTCQARVCTLLSDTQN